MWNNIGDGDRVREMRLRNVNGRKYVSEKHALGENSIWRFPHCSRLLGDDIGVGAQAICTEMGHQQDHLRDTALTKITALDSDFMLGNDDELTDEFDVTSSCEPAQGIDTSMSSFFSLDPDDVLENPDTQEEGMLEDGDH